MRILNQDAQTVTEYKYNGLGHRIGARWDVDADEDLDWEWFAYDDRWRIIARFGDSSAVDEPLEQIYHHHAGLAGLGGSSYIDLVIARDRFDYEEDTPVRARDYVLQNWRADVVVLAAPDGDLLERITYDAYGIPFATHPTDLTHGATGGVVGYGSPNGTVDASDYTYFLALYGGSNFRADWNRDGTLDAADNTAYTNDKNAATGSWGRGVLSNRSNLLGYAGYVHEPATGAAGGGHGTMWHVRHRVLHSGMGRWLQRDPVEYVDGLSLLSYGTSNPLALLDALGLACHATDSCIEPPPQPCPISGGVCDPLWHELFCVRRGPVIICRGDRITITIPAGPGIPPVTIPNDPFGCIPPDILLDPEVEAAFADAQAACGCIPRVVCSPGVSGGFTLPTPCPTIVIGMPPDPTTIRHELRHAQQLCNMGIPPLGDLCQTLLMWEMDAYQYANQCVGCDCCQSACTSVVTYTQGYCFGGSVSDCVSECLASCHLNNMPVFPPGIVIAGI